MPKADVRKVIRTLWIGRPSPPARVVKYRRDWLRRLENGGQSSASNTADDNPSVALSPLLVKNCRCVITNRESGSATIKYAICNRLLDLFYDAKEYTKFTT